MKLTTETHSDDVEYDDSYFLPFSLTMTLPRTLAGMSDSDDDEGETI